MNISALLLALLLSLTPYAQEGTTLENYYTMQGIVYVTETDGATLLDNSGNLWEVEDNTLYENELITMVFYDNGTPDREDDSIVAVLDTAQVIQIQRQ